MPVIFTALP